MDSTSPEMLALARQGQPLAVAAVVQQQLGDCDIDVTGWKRHDLLHIELLTIDRPIKAVTLQSIRQVLADLAPQHFRAVQVSAYMYGHEDPCWMERLALETRVGVRSSQHPIELKNAVQGAMDWTVGKSRWGWAVGGAAGLLLAIAGVASFGTGRQTPAVVQEQAPIRSRSTNDR